MAAGTGEPGRAGGGPRRARGFARQGRRGCDRLGLCLLSTPCPHLPSPQLPHPPPGRPRPGVAAECRPGGGAAAGTPSPSLAEFSAQPRGGEGEVQGVPGGRREGGPVSPAPARRGGWRTESPWAPARNTQLIITSRKTPRAAASRNPGLAQSPAAHASWGPHAVRSPPLGGFPCHPSGSCTWQSSMKRRL